MTYLRVPLEGARVPLVVRLPSVFFKDLPGALPTIRGPSPQNITT